MSKSRWTLIIVTTAVFGTLLFPRKQILVPAMEVTIYDESGSTVTNGEASRNWNHYLGSGWTSSIARTDSTGTVRFPEITRRVPIVVDAFWQAAAIPLHYHAGLAGSLTVRNADNHFIWQRIDFNDRNCCPTDVVITVHDRKGEADDAYFTFGKIVPNE